MGSKSTPYSIVRHSALFCFYCYEVHLVFVIVFPSYYIYTLFPASSSELRSLPIPFLYFKRMCIHSTPNRNRTCERQGLNLMRIPACAIGVFDCWVGLEPTISPPRNFYLNYQQNAMSHQFTFSSSQLVRLYCSSRGIRTPDLFLVRELL